MALIVDTGPLYASIDVADQDHRACLDLLVNANEPLVIPAPVLVEVDVLISRRLHQGLFIVLLDDIMAGGFTMEEMDPAYYLRIRQICERYSDANIGFVDAAVIAVTERLNEPKVATLDRRHFGVVRPAHVPALDLLPS